MSKVTIKFFDKEKGGYTDLLGLVVDSFGDVFDFSDGGYEFNGNLNRVYEPHFFVNGERIA